jgi:hypothetical protein
VNAAEVNIEGWWDNVKGWFGKKDQAATSAQVKFINDHINAEVASALLSTQEKAPNPFIQKLKE